MTETKHTPGPWRTDGLAVMSASGDTVCMMGEIDGFESGYQPCAKHRANGDLAAAAPTMAEALRASEAQFRWYAELHEAKGPEHAEKASRNRDMASMCRAALATAKTEA